MFREFWGARALPAPVSYAYESINRYWIHRENISLRRTDGSMDRGVQNIGL